MFHSGLLVLTSSTNSILACVPRVLHEASKHVKRVLYVHLAPGLGESATSIPHLPCSSTVDELITKMYVCAAHNHQFLDLRVVVGNIGPPVSRPKPLAIERYNLCHGHEVLLTDYPASDENNRSLVEYVQKYFSDPMKSTGTVKSISLDDSDLSNGILVNDEKLLDRYDNICMGGTFDILHTGHKILLSHAAMLANERLIVGVTDGKMSEKKSLPELMEACDVRISKTQEFLEDVKPQIIYEVVPIEDPYGPSIVDPNIQCIVVSQETLKGGEAVNNKRTEKGMTALAIDMINLVEDNIHEPGEETKISSSSLRKRMLGTLLRPPPQRKSTIPYIIGLTGGIASGKSSVCRRLEKLGAAIVDCDKLGHLAYAKDGAAYHKVIERFGQDVLAEDGTINRRALGPKIFGDDSARQDLNEIVWPVIEELAQQQIEQYSKEGKSVVILDAAVLLEASWDSMTNEIWTTVIPRDEAARRIIERNNLTEDAALKRIDSQMSNKERVERANVVLCTEWDYDVTQLQVEKAWSLLQSRL